MSRAHPFPLRTLALAVAAYALVSVSAQCDPVVCANPYSSQDLPSQTHKLLAAAVGGGGGSQFGSLSLQLRVPLYPNTIYPWVGTQYYAEFTGSMQFSNAPDPTAFYPIVLSATLAFDAALTPPVYMASCGLYVPSPGFNSSAAAMSAPYGTLSIQLLNSNVPGVGLQVVMSDASPVNPQHTVFNSGYMVTAMGNDAQVQVGMRVETVQGTLADTPCTVLPQEPSTAQFSNISLSTTDGPVPLALLVTPVTEPWCSLAVSVDNSAGVTTFSWANSTA